MKKIFLLILLLIVVGKIFATDIRAGEITYRCISGHIYELTITNYVKTSSGVIRPKLHINFGDNTAADVSIVDSTILSNDNSVNVYKTTHTYSIAGTYNIGVTEVNRNSGILNIPNSVNVAFYIASAITIDAVFTPNNSIQFLAPPLMTAQVGELFQQSVTSYDPDADYLTYKLISCRDSGNHNITGYSIPSGFFINNISGEITWSTPKIVGEYNFAVQVSKWKNGVIIGSVVRDFQITVYPTTPIRTIFMGAGIIWKLDSTKNYAFTVSPSDSIVLNVSYYDSSNNVKSLTTYSESLINGNNAVTKYTTGTNLINVVYKWKPVIGNARCVPYLVVFRGISLYNKEFGSDLSALIYVRNQSTQNCIAPTLITEVVQKYTNRVNIYPNPVSTSAFVELNGILPFSVSKFILYDIQGKELQCQQFSGNCFMFNKGNLSKGVYLFKVITKEDAYSGKILVD